MTFDIPFFQRLLDHLRDEVFDRSYQRCLLELSQRGLEPASPAECLAEVEDCADDAALRYALLRLVTPRVALGVLHALLTFREAATSLHPESTEFVNLSGLVGRELSAIGIVLHALRLLQSGEGRG